MSEFVNTVDVIGDKALTDSIIDRSVTEIADSATKSIGHYAFSGCISLTTVNFTAAKSTDNYAFSGCTSLTTANFSAATSIGGNVFYNCTSLTALVLRNTSAICTLGSTYALNNTPIQHDTGYIYVPAALVDSYKAATNWSTFVNQFRALEDYTVDGTTTGELDPTKIAA